MNKEEFKTEVLDSKKMVMVDFYADWCGPCKSLSTILDEVAKDMDENTKLVKIDVDKSSDLANHYGIRGIPTLLFIKDGQVVSTLVGVQTKDEIIKHLSK